jgi:bifunctional non-homologous end joining protein LigD
MPSRLQKKDFTIKVEGIAIPFSNKDKVLFPGKNFTKKDLLDYYLRISGYMLPLVKNRPLTVQRFPNGIENTGFFQKNLKEEIPDFLETANVPKEGGTNRHYLLHNKATLAYAVNKAAIIFHASLSTTNDLLKPDRLIFDLDPPEDGSFLKVKKAAKCLKLLLEELNLHPFLIATGSRGLHIVVPLKQDISFDESKEFAIDVGKVLQKRWPNDLTMHVRKVNRKGRIFIDVLRNAYSQTAIAPYSVRAKANAPVATPVFWEELDDPNFKPDKFHIKNVLRKIKSDGNPWKDIDLKKASVKDAKSKLPELNTEVC